MASTQGLINYYANLLILQYLGKDKNYACIQTLVTPVIMDQLPLAVQNAYNLTGSNLAKGKQLDVIGKYVGVTRSGLGFTGVITLTDDEFLVFIRFAILRNTLYSSYGNIVDLMWQFFPDQVFTYFHPMRMSFMIDSTVGNQNVIQLLVMQGFLPVPMAVGYNVIYKPVVNMFFGFRTTQAANINTVPFNTTHDYQTDWPWLTAKDGI